MSIIICRTSEQPYLRDRGRDVCLLSLPDSHAVNGQDGSPGTGDNFDAARMAICFWQGAVVGGCEIREWSVLLTNLLKIGLVS